MPRIKKDLPEESEVVICTVKTILKDSIFISLDEYENKEGLIHISEIAPGRIRNIRDYVKEGKKIVCLVLRVNKEKGHVDLSLRRASQSLRANKNESVKQEKKAEKLLEAACKKLNIDLDKMYDLIGNKIIQKYGALYPCLQEIVIKDESVLTSLGLDKKIAAEIVKIVKERIKPPEVRVDGTLSLMSKAPNGVDFIKKALKDAEDLAKSKKYDLRIIYLGAPRYKLTIKSTDYKIAEKELSEISEIAIKEIKKAGGTGNLTQEK